MDFIRPRKTLESYDQEDIHFETIQKSFAHYKNEYHRLLEENSLLQEENKKVRGGFQLEIFSWNFYWLFVNNRPASI